jgi:hypothetical protein
MKNILYLILFGAFFCASAHADETIEMTVYKTPTCGCCGKWIDHLRESGFTVITKEMSNLGGVKAENGVPRELSSCHTGVVDGYVIEGHVPADIILRLLKERPDVKGIAVPGMPVGSPGMEVPSGEIQPYTIMTFDEAGNTEVFATQGD